MKGRNVARRQARKLLSMLPSQDELSLCDNPAVDVEAIAKSLNINIVPFPFPENISGAFFKKDEKLFLGVNQEEADVRKRFTMAHEIGHYLLHPSDALHYDGPDVVYFRSANISKPEEVEANYFAAELLMPEERLTKCLDLGVQSISELARRFRVSEQAMTYRLTNLGLM